MKKPSCPLCGLARPVELYDEGYKRILRRLSGNSRFFCGHCAITWRQLAPLEWQDMKKKRHSAETSGTSIRQG